MRMRYKRGVIRRVGPRRPPLTTRRSLHCSLVRPQPVAEPGLGDEVARLARIGLELHTQVLDAHSQASRIVLPFRSPDLADELSLHHDRAEMARKAGEQPV